MQYKYNQVERIAFSLNQTDWVREARRFGTPYPYTLSDKMKLAIKILKERRKKWQERKKNITGIST